MTLSSTLEMHANAFSLRTTSMIGRYEPNASTSESASTSSTSLNAKKEICILGGGFGGLNAALTLSSLPWPNDDEKPTITLVDKKERFTFLPLLYELCVGDATLDEVAPTYTSLLKGTGIEFCQADVQGIDLDSDAVYLNPIGSGGQSSDTTTTQTTNKMDYDSLIVATGADINLKAIPGAEEFALPFYTLDNCLELRKRLTLLDALIEDKDFSQSDTIEVVVVGGGYSGVELALNIQERLQVGKGSGGGDQNQNQTNKKVKIKMIHRGEEVLQYATEFNRKTGVERLEKAGVEIITETSVVEVSALEIDDKEDAMRGLNGRCQVTVENIDTKGAQTFNADILLWTAGAMATNTQQGILNSKLPRDASGRIVTGKYLRAKDCDNVFTLGDCARVKQVPYGATAAVAMQQAPVAAWNVYATLTNDTNMNTDPELLPFTYLNLGEMMTLGGQDATISSMGLVEVNGTAASVLRRLIYAVRMPTAQQALTAALSSSGKRIEVLSKNQRKKNVNWQ